MARRYWPEGRAVGRLVRFSSRDPFNVEVVGVVPDVRYRMVREEARPSFYVPMAQLPASTGVIHVRYSHSKDQSGGGFANASMRLDELRRAISAVNAMVRQACPHAAHTDRAEHR
jgi:hypothetical protein